MKTISWSQSVVFIVHIHFRQTDMSREINRDTFSTKENNRNDRVLVTETNQWKHANQFHSICIKCVDKGRYLDVRSVILLNECVELELQLDENNNITKKNGSIIGVIRNHVACTVERAH